MNTIARNKKHNPNQLDIFALAMQQIPPTKITITTPKANTPAEATPIGKGIDYSKNIDQIISGLSSFGIQKGTTKKQREELNQKAQELLDSLDGNTVLTSEQESILSQYSGEGGIGDSLNEYYTNTQIATAMWKLLDNLGIRSGQVLEPSCGIGAFIATKPNTIKVTGVELSPISAKIAKLLHRDSEIINSSFEAFSKKDKRRFDAVIGNVPFGIRGKVSGEDKAKSYLKTAEQYFIDTALDKTKDNGIVMLIIPTSIMDNITVEKFRKNILRKAEFLACHRLPNDSFAHSHTSVTADIIVLQKREAPYVKTFKTKSYEIDDILYSLNMPNHDSFIEGEWFETNNGMRNIHGQADTNWMDQNIVLPTNINIPSAILNGYINKPGPSSDIHFLLEKASNSVMASILKDELEKEEKVETIINEEEDRCTEQVHLDALEIATSIEKLIHLEKHVGRYASEPVRKRIITLLNTFVEAYGVPSKNKKLLYAAEKHTILYHLIGAVKDNGAYSDIIMGTYFFQKEQDINYNDIHSVFNHLYKLWGSLSIQDIAYHSSIPKKEIETKLLESSKYAVDPETQKWEPIEDYLTGELYDKLEIAKEIINVTIEPYLSKYKIQVELLHKTIDPKAIEEIETALHSGWIPLDVIEKFFIEKDIEQTGSPDIERTINIKFENAAFFVDYDFNHGELSIFNQYINRLPMKKENWEIVDKLNTEFKEWVSTSSERSRLEEIYNKLYRSFKPKNYSDEPYPIPGINEQIALNGYHYGAVRRSIDLEKGILSFDVGLGKTFNSVITAKELKRLGKIKKPLIVVPKSTVSNWVSEINTLFPNSNYILIGETIKQRKNGDLSSVSDDKQTRGKKLHMAKQNDYDFILMSSPAFEELDLNEIDKWKYIKEDFWYQRSETLNLKTNKRILQAEERYEQTCANLDFVKRTNVTYFDDIGVDAIFLDESHAYKNLNAPRERRGNKPMYLGGGTASKRSFDLLYKTKWLRERNNGKHIYLITATPAPNSPIEIYTMISYLAPEEFENRGIRNAEEFIDRYCLIKMETVLKTNGMIEEVPIVYGFKNMNELRPIMRKYINRKTGEEVGLKLPIPEQVMHTFDMSEQQLAVYETLRVEIEKAKGDKRGDAHIFSVMGRMEKASMDLELLSPIYKDEPSPKFNHFVNTLMNSIHRGGQIVFCDSKVSHEKIKNLIIAKGLDEKYISIINGETAESSMERQKIADKFNRGELKVVIGNNTMREGLNLQKTTSDIHHLDLPWNFAMIHQRNGRGVRQGNPNDTIKIHTYMAKRSFDGYRYQLINGKRAWSEMLWSNDDTIENLAQENKFSKEDIMIMMSRDPEEARKKIEEIKEKKIGEYKEKMSIDAISNFNWMMNMKKTLTRLNPLSESAKILYGKIKNILVLLKNNEYFQFKDVLEDTREIIINPDKKEYYVKNEWYLLDDDQKVYIADIMPTSKMIEYRCFGYADTCKKELNKDTNLIPIAIPEDDELKEILKQEDFSIDQLNIIPEDILLKNTKKIQVAIMKQFKEGTRPYLFKTLSREIKGTSYRNFRDTAQIAEFIIPTEANKASFKDLWLQDEDEILYNENIIHLTFGIQFLKTLRNIRRQIEKEKEQQRQQLAIV